MVLGLPRQRRPLTSPADSFETQLFSDLRFNDAAQWITESVQCAVDQYSSVQAKAGKSGRRKMRTFVCKYSKKHGNPGAAAGRATACSLPADHAARTRTFKERHRVLQQIGGNMCADVSG
jgi:hypothetical protein